MSATVDALERMHDYEDLDRSMRGRLRRARRWTTSTRTRCAARWAMPAAQDLRRLKEIETDPGAGRASCTQADGRLEVTPRGARKLGERALDAGLRGAEARPRGHARRSGRRRPGRADRRHRRGTSATTARSPCRRPCSTPSSAIASGRAGAAASRRLRDDRGRAAHRDGDGAAAGPLVLHAAARALRPREEDGAGAARADRGALPARHAVPDRVQRLRAPDAARGPHRARIRARVRHEHAARVQAGGPAAGAAPARDRAGDHGDRRRAHGAPRGRSGVLLVAAGARDDPPDARRGDAAVALGRDDSTSSCWRSPKGSRNSWNAWRA